MKAIKGIHVVSLDVPFPPDYGAMIDVYHRCKALKKLGIYVVLHCFEYGRGQKNALLDVADEVHYYTRKKNIFDLFSSTPFIVKSRANKCLLEQLIKNNFPILFEGVHTCAFAAHPALKNRWKGVRAHNVEHDYYAELAKIEKKLMKRFFFSIEAKKLAHFESIFHHVQEILTVSPKDTAYFQSHYQKGKYLPVFNPLSWGNSEVGTKKYALFHGNLSVIENENAVRYLIAEVWEKTFSLDLVIAGKNPSKNFQQYLSKLPFNVSCIANPSDENLNQLIREAKINLLATFQNTGIKHKLLNCLANGAFCLASPQMVEGTGLEKWVEAARSTQEWKQKIRLLTDRENDFATWQARREYLKTVFDIEKNAKQLIQLSGIV
jgi:hypothetical protein